MLHPYSITMTCYDCHRHNGITKRVDEARNIIYVGCRNCRIYVWLPLKENRVTIGIPSRFKVLLVRY